MFTVFAVLGWLLIMIAVLVVAAFSGFGMYVHVLINGHKASASLVKFATTNPIIKFLNENVYGANKVTDLFFGKEGATSWDVLQLWIIPIIAIAASIFIVVIAVMELSRLKKSQKVSKPFVKIIIIATLALNLIFGKMATVIAGGTMFLGLILLEIVLFDTDALNNFAEERNLVSIYREEKKFEREVSKEGKVNWQNRFGNVRGQKGQKYKYVGPRWESKNKW
jgi:hypothetical protein